MLGRLSFGTPPLWWLKGGMQISVIGHPLQVPISGLTGALHDRWLAGSFVSRWLGVRGLEPMAESYGLTPN